MLVDPEQMGTVSVLTVGPPRPRYLPLTSPCRGRDHAFGDGRRFLPRRHPSHDAAKRPHPFRKARWGSRMNPMCPAGPRAPDLSRNLVVEVGEFGRALLQPHARRVRVARPGTCPVGRARAARPASARSAAAACWP